MIAEEEPRSPDAGPDPLADDGETMRDIRTCETLHEARASFQDALVEGSAVQGRHFAAQLRQEPVYQMAEFFFLLRAFRLDGEGKIRRYAELHNRHLEGLRADRTKMRRLGLSPSGEVDRSGLVRYMRIVTRPKGPPCRAARQMQQPFHGRAG